MIKSEIDTMTSNRRRIWEELKRRRSPQNRLTRRSGKAAKVAKMPSTDRGEDPPPSDGNALSGTLKQVSAWFPEADALAQVQALKLNAALEAKGILESIKPSSTPEEVGPHLIEGAAPSPWGRASQLQRSLRYLWKRPPFHPVGGEGGRRRERGRSADFRELRARAYRAIRIFPSFRVLVAAGNRGPSSPFVNHMCLFLPVYFWSRAL